MSMIEESNEIKRLLNNLVDKEIDEKSKECLRLYKAVVTSVATQIANKWYIGVKIAPHTTAADNSITILSTYMCKNCAVGDYVWVAKMYNSMNNAFAMYPMDFIFGTDYSGGGGNYLPLSAGSSYPLTGTLYTQAILSNIAGYQIGSLTQYFGNIYAKEFDLKNTTNNASDTPTSPSKSYISFFDKGNLYFAEIISIIANDYNSLLFAVSGKNGNRREFELYNAYSGGVHTYSLRPLQNDIDLGTIFYKWKDLYLGGAIKDGTNTFTLPSASGTLALISDITAPSNPNLLINSNFAINQRGQASYTTTGSKKPTVDRVVTNRSVITPQTPYGIMINAASGQNNPYIQQTIENANTLVGEYLTLSANVDGVVYTQTTTTVPSANSTTAYYNQNFTWGSYTFNLQLTKYTVTTGDVLQVTLTLANPNNTIIKWWKLEVGQKATTYIPPLLAEELPKCQRYYQVLGKAGTQSNYGVGYCYNSTTIWLAIPEIIQKMRVNPTITAGTLANFRIVTNTGLGSGLVPTAVSFSIGSILFTVSGATAYARYNIFDAASNQNGIIYLDAEMY